MSVSLTACSTTTILPNPLWDDSINLKDTIELKRTSTGKVYTYVKNASRRRRLVLGFELTLHKGLELQAFFHSYPAERLTIVDHLKASWSGYLVNNPLEFETSGRGYTCYTDETLTVQLELEVVPSGYEEEL
jgi:hypothetical protein